jgi:hypothetical protein
MKNSYPDDLTEQRYIFKSNSHGPKLLHKLLTKFTVTHGLTNYNRHQSKMPSSKKIDLSRDFAAGVYRLEIQLVMLLFRPSIVNCCPSNIHIPFNWTYKWHIERKQNNAFYSMYHPVL